MTGRTSSLVARWMAPALIALGLGVGLSAFLAQPAAAQHKMNENDMELPIDDAAVVELGREKYAQRCSFCHGGGGKGGKGPCLTCGRFKYGGRASQIYANIAGGVQGTQMGAFESSLSREEILGIIAYLRVQTEERRKAGELE